MPFSCYTIEEYYSRIYDNQILLSIKGDERYYSILMDAFDDYYFTARFQDRFRPNFWCTYVHQIDTASCRRLNILLERFKSTVFIDDALDQTFALDYLWNPGYNAGRTPIGELAHQAKPYRKNFTEHNQQHALKLAAHYADFIQIHPSYARSDYLISIPSRGKKFDLPSFISQAIGAQLPIQSGQEFIDKIRDTPSLKDVPIEKRSDIIRNVFEIKDNHPFKDKTIILIDDFYDTGSTLHEVGTLLQRNGAKVLGLVATKTFKGT